jgi:hypothetical protein
MKNYLEGYVQFQDPILRSASSAHLTNLCVRHVVIDCRKVKEYEVVLASSGLTSKPNFMKIGHLVQKFTCLHDIMIL